MLHKHDWFIYMLVGFIPRVDRCLWYLMFFGFFLQYLHTGLVSNIIIFALQMKMRKHNIWVSNGFAGVISYQI